MYNERKLSTHERTSSNVAASAAAANDNDAKNNVDSAESDDRKMSDNQHKLTTALIADCPRDAFELNAVAVFAYSKTPRDCRVNEDAQDAL